MGPVTNWRRNLRVNMGISCYVLPQEITLNRLLIRDDLNPHGCMTERPNIDFAQQNAKLKQLRALAGLLDEAIVIPGTKIRVGFDSLIGLVPVVGDTLTALFSAYIIQEAAKLGAPRKLLLKMTFNLAVDVVAGSVPLAGDVFDVLWKANKKNLDLLEEFLKKKVPQEPFIDV